MDSEQIAKFIDHLEKESNIIRENCMRHAWTMRGGIQYNDVMNLSSVERKMIDKLGDDNIETTQKSGLPYF